MAQLKKDLVANFVGQGWATIVGFLVVPFYIKILGIEAYGLIGFYQTIQTVFNYFLDFGLSTTINREISRYQSIPRKSVETRDLVRTLEVIYWCIGIMLGVAVRLSAPLLVTYWIKPGKLPVSDIQNVIAIMGILVFLQWPISFYQGGLIGLQKIVTLNGINASFFTFRSVGAVVTVFFSPTLNSFFSWQILASFLQVTVMTATLWVNLPAGGRIPKFRTSILKRIWRFAAGMTGTSLISFFLGQVDKILLSRLLSLEMFGYYMLATNINNAFRIGTSQVFSAVFPRFSALVATNDEGKLRHLFHKSCQLVAVVSIAPAAVVLFFAPELIRLWTNDPQSILISAPIAALLVSGSALNNLIGIPYDLTLAYGWSSFGFYQNLIAVIVIFPLMFFMSTYFGGIGAAAAWLILNIGYLVVVPHFIFYHYLRGERIRWYLFDVLLPLAVTLLVVFTARLLTPYSMTFVRTALALAVVSFLAFAAGLFCAPEIRSVILRSIKLNYDN
jgi:O-antigen/teichoic acid export membrane protein